MIKYGIDNIRDLVGPKVDLQMVQDSPICRLDKDSANENLDDVDLDCLEKEWDSLIERLQSLQQTVTGLKSKLGLAAPQETCTKNLDITIFADPKYPPYAVLILANMIRKQFGLNISYHCHSTVKNISDELKYIFSPDSCQSKTSTNNLCIIWKDVGTNLELIVSPVAHGKIIGEVNTVRYLSRMLEMNGNNMKWFESISADHCTQVDYWLDKAHEQALQGPKKAQAFVRSLDIQLNSQNYIVGVDITPADVYVFSLLYRLKIVLPKNVENWFQKCKSHQWLKNSM